MKRSLWFAVALSLVFAAFACRARTSTTASIAQEGLLVRYAYAAQEIPEDYREPIQTRLAEHLLAETGESRLTAIEVSYSCNVSDFSKVFCSFSFSMETGILGLGSFEISKNRDTGEYNFHVTGFHSA